MKCKYNSFLSQLQRTELIILFSLGDMIIVFCKFFLVLLIYFFPFILYFCAIGRDISIANTLILLISAHEPVRILAKYEKLFS